MSYGGTWRMPDVIANTSPLQYLFQLDLLELLPEFYGEVLIPGAVVLGSGRPTHSGCRLCSDCSRYQLAQPGWWVGTKREAHRLAYGW